MAGGTEKSGGGCPFYQDESLDKVYFEGSDRTLVLRCEKFIPNEKYFGDGKCGFGGSCGYSCEINASSQQVIIVGNKHVLSSGLLRELTRIKLEDFLKTPKQIKPAPKNYGRRK